MELGLAVPPLVRGARGQDLDDELRSAAEVAGGVERRAVARG
jgi:hypothetical protein